MKYNLEVLYDETIKHYADKRNDDGIPLNTQAELDEDMLQWLEYFIDTDCTENCRKAVELHLPYGSSVRAKSYIAEELGVSKGMINKRLIEAYRIVRFCVNSLCGIPFKSLDERINLKLYDSIFIREVLNDIKSRTARGCYINGLYKVGIITVEDLINCNKEDILKSDRISERLLVLLSDKLNSIGIDDFYYQYSWKNE